MENNLNSKLLKIIHPALHVSNIKNLIPVVLDDSNNNYDSWCTLFCIAARAYNVVDHIDSSIPTPWEAVVEPSLWAQLDAVVVSWICATISPHLLATLLHENSTTTAMDAWISLRHMFQPNTTQVMLTSSKRYSYLSKKKKDENADLISNLADDILAYLLSFLELKTAGRSSILSKRWRYVWTYMMHLDFDSRTCQSDWNEFKFGNLVNEVIAANRAPYLDRFRVDFWGIDLSEADVEEWLRFALLNKKVGELDMKWLPSISDKPVAHFTNIIPATAYYRYPYSYSSRDGLRVVNTSLARVALEFVYCDGPLLEWILCACVNLKHVSLRECKIHCGPTLVVSCTKLEHLELTNCLKPLNHDYYYVTLQICAPKLSSIVLSESDQGFPRPIVSSLNYYSMLNRDSSPSPNILEFGNVPSLVDATFGRLFCHHFFHTPNNIISSLCSQLNRLSITWDEAYFRFYGCQSFANVRQLEIVYVDGDDLLQLTSLIKACPSLDTFRLKLRNWQEGKERNGSVGEIKAKAIREQEHEQLKVVEFVGFNGSGPAISLANYLISHAPMLNKLVFNTTANHQIQTPTQTDFATYMAHKIAMGIQPHRRLHVVIL